MVKYGDVATGAIAAAGTVRIGGSKIEASVEEALMSYPIADLEGVAPGVANVLKSVGIRTTRKLLEKARSPSGRKLLAEQIGISEKEILRWANMADRMRIKGVGEDYAELLQAAGVDTVRELKYRNPSNLAKAMAVANAQRKLVELLPSEKAVIRWIAHAKTLPLKISY
jgi:predicted flap endonuclease-1-like 5' DNA nuclease